MYHHLDCIGTLYTRKQIENILSFIKTHKIGNVFDVYLISQQKFIKRIPPNIVYYDELIESKRTNSNKLRNIVNIRNLIKNVSIRNDKLKKKDEE